MSVFDSVTVAHAQTVYRLKPLVESRSEWEGEGRKVHRMQKSKIKSATKYHDCITMWIMLPTVCR